MENIDDKKQVKIRTRVPLGTRSEANSALESVHYCFIFWSKNLVVSMPKFVTSSGPCEPQDGGAEVPSGGPRRPDFSGDPQPDGCVAQRMRTLTVRGSKSKYCTAIWAFRSGRPLPSPPSPPGKVFGSRGEGWEGGTETQERRTKHDHTPLTHRGVGGFDLWGTLFDAI